MSPILLSRATDQLQFEEHLFFMLKVLILSADVAGTTRGDIYNIDTDTYETTGNCNNGRDVSLDLKQLFCIIRAVHKETSRTMGDLPKKENSF